MVSWFVFMVWVGGIHVAYGRCREAGQTRTSAVFSGIFWPLGVGAYIAANAFDPHE